MRGGREGLQTTSMRTGHEMVETSLDNGGDTNDHPQSRPHRGAPRPRPRGFPQPPNGPSARLPRLKDSKPKRSGLSFIQLMRMCRDSSLDFIKAFGQIFDSNTAKKKTGPKIYTTTSAWPSLPAVRQCPTVDLSPPLLRIKIQNTSKGINNYY